MTQSNPNSNNFRLRVALRVEGENFRVPALRMIGALITLAVIGARLWFQFTAH